MPRFYDPATGTEALDGVHDTTGGTLIDDMPADSREWFERPAATGKQWQTDPTGKFPIEVDIPPPTAEEQTAADRDHARSELARTDHAVLSDSKYTGTDLTAITAYRHALRSPQRTASPWTRPTLSVEVD